MLAVFVNDSVSPDAKLAAMLTVAPASVVEPGSVTVRPGSMVTGVDAPYVPCTKAVVPGYVVTTGMLAVTLTSFVAAMLVPVASVRVKEIVRVAVLGAITLVV